MKQLTFPDLLAEKLRDNGMQRAVEHADRVEAKWSERAYGMLQSYLRLLGAETFLSEDVRFFAEANGLPVPPDKRAWGAVMMRAAKAGLIHKKGWTTAKDPKVHKNPVSLWKNHD